MAATTAGAFKAHLEAQGLGVQVFRDGPRPGQKLPYIVVQEGLDYARHPTANGDYGDPDSEIVIREMVQVDVVQLARHLDVTNAPNSENYELAERVMWLCSQPRLTASPTEVNGVQFMAAHRDPIVDNVVRHVITVQVTRTLQKPGGTP